MGFKSDHSNGSADGRGKTTTTSSKSTGLSAAASRVSAAVSSGSTTGSKLSAVTGTRTTVFSSGSSSTPTYTYTRSDGTVSSTTDVRHSDANKAAEAANRIASSGTASSSDVRYINNAIASGAASSTLATSYQTLLSNAGVSNAATVGSSSVAVTSLTGNQNNGLTVTQTNSGSRTGVTVGSGSNNPVSVNVQTYDMRGYGMEAYDIGDEGFAFAGTSSEALEEYFRKKQKKYADLGDVDRSEYFGHQADLAEYVNLYKETHPELEERYGTYGNSTGTYYEGWTSKSGWTIDENGDYHVTYDPSSVYDISGYPGLSDSFHYGESVDSNGKYNPYGTVTQAEYIGSSLVSLKSDDTTENTGDDEAPWGTVRYRLTHQSDSSELKADENAESVSADATLSEEGTDFLTMAGNSVDNFLGAIDNLSENYGVAGYVAAGAMDIALPLDAISTVKKMTDGRWEDISVTDVLWSIVDVISLVPVVGSAGWILKGLKFASYGVQGVATAVTAGTSFITALNSDESTDGETPSNAASSQTRENMAYQIYNKSNTAQTNLSQSGSMSEQTIIPTENGNAGTDQQTAESNNLADILAGVLNGLVGSSSSSGGGGTTTNNYYTTNESGLSETLEKIKPYIFPVASIVAALIGIALIFKENKKPKAGAS